MAANGNLPGVVVVAAQVEHWSGICTGGVLKAVAVGDKFDEYVLTARHCLARDRHGGLRLGVTIPRQDDDEGAIQSEVFVATVVYASRAHGTTGAGTIVWDDGDWAIVRFRAPVRWPTLNTFDRDPKEAVPAGVRCELSSYADHQFIDLHAQRRGLVSHIHSFYWAGVPKDIEQPGHSGAPVTCDGKVVGIFVGATENSLGCQLLCGERWPKKLRFVSIATVRAQAAQAGFEF
jgi:hypothetical protein